MKPFFLNYQEDWINIDPSILWSGGFDKKIIENPKILIRQTGYQIVTCVDKEGYYHLNNCHSLSPKDKKLNLFALSVVLNSKEFTEVYQILSMEKGRALAQIDIEFLLKIKIPLLSTTQEKKLENFYFKQSEKVRNTKEIEEYLLYDHLRS